MIQYEWKFQNVDTIKILAKFFQIMTRIFLPIALVEEFWNLEFTIFNWKFQIRHLYHIGTAENQSSGKRGKKSKPGCNLWLVGSSARTFDLVAFDVILESFGALAIFLLKCNFQTLLLVQNKTKIIKHISQNVWDFLN